MPKPVDPRYRQINNWAKATEATRQDIQKKGITDTNSIVKALAKSAGTTSVADPTGHDHRLNKK